MIWIWVGFVLFILALLALDLGVFNRKAHVVSVREALGWSALWIALGLGFTVFIYFAYENHWLGIGHRVDTVDGIVNDGHAATVKYLTGYVIEKSLSVDNIFVIALIFAYFGVPAMYQHRVLFWGIVGALVMRGAMIGIGAALIARFHWILYVFGAFLIVTAVRMLTMGGGHGEPGKNPVVRLARRLFPVTDEFHGQHFLVRAGSGKSREPATPGAPARQDAAVEGARQGLWMLTPLALALVVVETTDLVFAVDSIPAIFAITADPFLVFTSNVFAILGLRSLYFALAGMMDQFRYLKVSLAVVLALVGVKMLAAGWFKQLLGEHYNIVLLAVIFGILGAGVAASLVANRRDRRRAAAAPAPAPPEPAAPGMLPEPERQEPAEPAGAAAARASEKS
jgi:tellurite resistance protein TerC